MSQTSEMKPHPRQAARAVLVTALLTGSVAVALPVGTAAAAGNTLLVDASQSIRPVTHVGSGGLYALADDANPDAAQLPPRA